MDKNLEAKGISLVDAVLQHSKHPSTFDIPSKMEIQQIKVGGFVKLTFLSPSGGERMWVKVVEIKAGGGYKGKLDNTPMFAESLYLGDIIEFEEFNIIDIMNRAD